MSQDRRAALEAAIDAGPLDRAAPEVYADELQRLGEPRGELIALQLADGDDLEARIRALIDANHFEPDARLRNVHWRWGFVRSAELAAELATPTELVAILEHPSLRFLSSLFLPANEAGHQPRSMLSPAGRGNPSSGSKSTGRAMMNPESAPQHATSAISRTCGHSYPSSTRWGSLDRTCTSASSRSRS